MLSTESDQKSHKDACITLAINNVLSLKIQNIVNDLLKKLLDER